MRINELAIPHYSLFETIQIALDRHYISDEKAESIYQEIEELTLHLALHYQHQNSSSVSQSQFLRIIDTINYMFKHSCKDPKALNDHSIVFFFEDGLHTLKRDTQKIQAIYDSLKTQILPIQNDRYLSIINEQIPNFLKTLQEYRAVFNYCYVEGDLDYPLIDGLPLDHDMYGLSGIDLVIYYIRRFTLENRFCWYFRHDLPELIGQYVALKGISIDYLSINLFELIVCQMTAYSLLHHSIGLFFEKTDIDELKNILSDKDITHEITSSLSHVADQEVRNYLLSYKENIIRIFKYFIYESYDAFLYQPAFSEKTMVYLESSDNAVFDKAFDDLKEMTKVEEKIQYLSDIPLYDMLDLLENDIFYGKEYWQFFSSMDLKEVAVIIKLLNPNGDAFHQTQCLNRSLLEELESSMEWQRQFIHFLKALSSAKLSEIEKWLNCLKIVC
ncbi:MAG: DUF6179 domain-containing protein [Beduini sp.]|uniref:DUF6179 domain-containing protein n=1 Tax=Beduini sp. TaxID=1922300 RepID=UPI0011CBEB02